MELRDALIYSGFTSGTINAASRLSCTSSTHPVPETLTLTLIHRHPTCRSNPYTLHESGRTYIYDVLCIMTHDRAVRMHVAVAGRVCVRMHGCA
eukprot:212783-Chlamydomonas_euryale.AAC.2